jgi:opacity protein-like surface antigen
MTNMIKLLMAATALVAVATPALAAADGPYVGIEGGVTLPQNSGLDVILNNTTTYDNGYRVNYKDGIDVDAVAGYKLGPVRLEAEGGYKRAKVKSLGVSTPLVTDVGAAAGTTATADDFSAGNHIGIKTLMANALLDSNFGNSRFGGYVGGGGGRAWASMSGDKDDAWAYQGIAGLRYALTPNVDAGVKYRYFRTGNLGFDDAFTVNNVPFTTETSGHYSSHSVLASLAYNFNGHAAHAAPEAPPPPPPPAPEAPATQTCPDGSVILATSVCPVPPPPPPPPPAASGERGR